MINSSIRPQDPEQFGNAVGTKEDPAGKGGPIVFPNPASSRLSIRDIDPATSVEVFNALGERVYAARSPQGIDIGHWNEDVYYVRTDYGSAVHSTRFTVQH
ncbi:MAG: T9SS type A sorting domain-containing protein [Flavobacteriales bacterium]|nr:T9SS type A sorting domain-containing protein [Flavobacteriales bacterium]